MIETRRCNICGEPGPCECPDGSRGWRPSRPPRTPEQQRVDAFAKAVVFVVKWGAIALAIAGALVAYVRAWIIYPSDCLWSHLIIGIAALVVWAVCRTDDLK